MNGDNLQFFELFAHANSVSTHTHTHTHTHTYTHTRTRTHAHTHTHTHAQTQSTGSEFSRVYAVCSLNIQIFFEIPENAFLFANEHCSVVFFYNGIRCSRDTLRHILAHWFFFWHGCLDAHEPQHVVAHTQHTNTSKTHNTTEILLCRIKNKAQPTWILTLHTHTHTHT